MTNYSQRDPHWSSLHLGTSSVSIGQSGCAITALAMLCGKTPAQVNQILINGGGFAQQNLVIWSRACQLLGLTWQGQSGSAAHNQTIAQVRGAGFPMHFVVWLGNGQIADPWDGRTKANPYQVVLFDNVQAPAPVAPPAPAQGSFTVRVDKAIANVRTAPNGSAALGGSRQLGKGATFVAVALVDGENVGGNNKWYKSARGNFVWSGGLTRI